MGRINLAERQNVLPLVADMLLRIPESSNVNPSLCMKLKQVGVEAMMRYDRHRAVAQRVLDVLEETGLQPIVMKGLRLAALYPKPYLRQWGDMDVLVDGSQQKEMIAAMEHAFPDADHHIEYEGLMRHLNFELKEGVIVEVHRNTRTYYNQKKFRYYQSVLYTTMQKEGIIWSQLLQLRFPQIVKLLYQNLKPQSYRRKGLQIMREKRDSRD